MNANRPDLIVITGCDSGIGKGLADDFLKRGYQVAISYLEDNQFLDHRAVYAKKMDLRIAAEVHDFCRYIQDLCQETFNLKAVVLNAGVALGGPIENVPMALYRESFEINYFGVVALVQATIPFLTRDKGRIMIIGSLAGRIAMPFLSPYVSTKFALEGFCDSLRREMNPWGVTTILIEPAAIATPIWRKAVQQDVSFVDAKYSKSLQRFREGFIEDGNRGLDTKQAASFIADILFKKKPGARYIVAKNRLVSNLLLLLPYWVLDKAVVKMFQMEYGKGS